MGECGGGGGWGRRRSSPATISPPPPPPTLHHHSPPRLHTHTTIHCIPATTDVYHCHHTQLPSTSHHTTHTLHTLPFPYHHHHSMVPTLLPPHHPYPFPHYHCLSHCTITCSVIIDIDIDILGPMGENELSCMPTMAAWQALGGRWEQAGQAGAELASRTALPPLCLSLFCMSLSTTLLFAFLPTCLPPQWWVPEWGTVVTALLPPLSHFSPCHTYPTMPHLPLTLSPFPPPSSPLSHSSIHGLCSCAGLCFFVQAFIHMPSSLPALGWIGGSGGGRGWRGTAGVLPSIFVAFAFALCGLVCFLAFCCAAHMAFLTVFILCHLPTPASQPHAHFAAAHAHASQTSSHLSSEA